MTNTNEIGASLAPRLFRERDVAHYLGVSVFTLQKWRQKGIGPAFRKLATPNNRTAPVRYEKRDVDEWLDKQNEAGGALCEVTHA